MKNLCMSADAGAVPGVRGQVTAAAHHRVPHTLMPKAKQMYIIM